MYMYQGTFFQKELFMGDFLSKNLFMGKLLGEIYGEGLFDMEELMIKSCQGSGVRAL